MNVLVSLFRGYGLGDAVQMSAVLRHLARHRPEWVIDYQAEAGREVVGRGIVAHTFAYGEPAPTATYDAEVQILLFDMWANWHDRPNTRVSSCLRERFGLDWDPACGRYEVRVDWGTSEAVAACLPEGRAVAIHYRGDSDGGRKNLTDAQAAAVCAEVRRLGRTPLLIDWRNESPIPATTASVCTTGRQPWQRKWGGNAAYNAALIGLCEAFVGIDSGPGKCASATTTPALITWTGHHPAPFHDPAPNTSHLVPRGYHGLDPVCDDPGVIRWFEANHTIRHYDACDPVPAIRQWLREVLP